jgi:HK97 family phage major capsid protein
MVEVPGLSFARLAICLALGDGNLSTSQRLADARWGVGSIPSTFCRAAISGGSIADATWASTLAVYENAAQGLVEAIRPRTILGRLQGLRRVPMNTKVPRVTTGSSATWIGELQAGTVTNLSLDQTTMAVTKIATQVVASMELARFSDPSAEMTVRNDLIAACAECADRAFISNAAGQTGVKPAGIANGSAAFASGGSTALLIAADIKMLCDALADNGILFRNPYLVMSGRNAIGLATKMSTTGSPAFPLATAAGGEVCGIPIIATASAAVTGDSPDTSIVTLLDASEILLADPSEAVIQVTKSASVQMDTNPDSPPTSSTSQISFWQSNLVGWRIQRLLNWELARPGAVAQLTGCSW